MTDADSTYADDMAREHADDTPQASPIATEPTTPVQADTVTYGTMGDMAWTGYMAVPADHEGDAPLPGLIVIQEWWGLNDNIELMTRKLAAEGYRALAVDLYDGHVAETPQDAQQYMRAAMARGDTTIANLKAAYAFLAQQYDAPVVGSIGWCFGGGMSLQAALALPDQLDATVIYYGRVGDATREQLAQLQMPVVAFFGADDRSLPPDVVHGFEQTMKDLGKDVHVYVYDGAGHAFANPSGGNFRPEAANDAWSKTLTFLDAHLRGEGEGLPGNAESM